MDRGYVSRTVRRLDEEGLIDHSDDGKLRPRDPDLMLTSWEDQYKFVKHDIIRGHVPARSGRQLTKDLVEVLLDGHVDHAFTGLAAADMIAPFANFRLVAVYLRYAPKRNLLDRLAFQEGKKGANTWLVIPNDEGVFDGSQMIDHLRCVSVVQTYLDLQHMPERAKEAAEHLRGRSMPWR